MKRKGDTQTLSKKPWKIGQRVCIMSSKHIWGTIVKVVDLHKEHPMNARRAARGDKPILKFPSARRYRIHVLWDGKTEPQSHNSQTLYREGEGNNFWGIMREKKD